jgi:GTP-binding protein Era
MSQTVTKAVNDADLVLFMIDATKDLIDQEKATISRLKASATSIILAINKVDVVKKWKILPLIDELHINSDTNDILPISALTGEGLEELKKVVSDLLPMGQPLYPLDQITEHPEKFFVAEIIREKIFLKYGNEIPYATTVLIDEFKERKGRKDYINARIIVERQSQKAILIGKGGKALKEIGQLARDEIEAILGRAVFLELWVAVRGKWRSKDLFLKEFGYK